MVRDRHARRSRWFIGAAGVFSLGFTALVTSFIAEPRLPTAIGWGDADWDAFRVARKRVLDLEIGVSKVRLRAPELPAEPLALRIAREELDRIEQRLQRARAAPGRLVTALRSGGSALLGVGAVLLLIAKRIDRQRLAR